MRVDRPNRPVGQPLLRYKPPPIDLTPQLRAQPCPGCDLAALYRVPDEGFTSCGSCGLVLTDDEYLAEPVEDPEMGESVPPSHPPVVYYMRLDAIVKIGFTTRLGRRLMDINPQGVLAVEWGARRLEMERHNQFADHHVHGEWFRWGEALADHVVAVRTTFETDMGRSTEAWLADVGAAWWVEPDRLPASGES